LNLVTILFINTLKIPYDIIINKDLQKVVGFVDATTVQLMALHGQPATAFDNKICFEWDCAALGLMIQAPKAFKRSLQAHEVDPNSIYTWSIISDCASAVTRLQAYYNFIAGLECWAEHPACELCPALGLHVEFKYKVV